MRYEELADVIKSTGLKTSYRYFKDKTGLKPPFIVWYADENDDLFADNINYQEIVNVVIELYTGSVKNRAIERQVEEALKKNEIAYSKSEVYISAEKSYEIIYESEVVING